MKRKFGKMSMIMLASTLLAGAAPAMNALAAINYHIDTSKTMYQYYALSNNASALGDECCQGIYGNLASWKNMLQDYPDNETLLNRLWNGVMSPLTGGIYSGHIKLENGSIICTQNSWVLGTYDAPEADAVSDKISAIGTAAYTEACKDKIEEARSAYEALPEDEQALVTNYAVLTDAEREYAALKAAADQAAADAAAAAEVSNKISAIGTVAYTEACKARIDEAISAFESLTSDQRMLVTNHEDLTTAEREYAALKEAADQAAADAAAAAEVSNKINAIGTVAYTEASKANIDEARSAYEALTSDQKALVTNYAVLTTAESDYAALKAAADQAAADKTAADEAAADKNETQETAAEEPETPAKAERIKGVTVSSAKAGNKKVTLKWNEVKGATSYTVYYSECNGKAYKKKATVTGTQYVVKNLNNKKQYKFCIKANGEDNTLSSITCHVAMPKNKRTNPKSIKLNFKSAALTVGKTRTIKATIKKEKSGKKLIGHVAKVRYYSSDKAVAKVSAKGKITAVSKGTAVIYAVAENGLSQTVNVTVK